MRLANFFFLCRCTSAPEYRHSYFLSSSTVLLVFQERHVRPSGTGSSFSCWRAALVHRTSLPCPWLRPKKHSGQQRPSARTPFPVESVLSTVSFCLSSPDSWMAITPRTSRLVKPMEGGTADFRLDRHVLTRDLRSGIKLPRCGQTLAARYLKCWQNLWSASGLLVVGGCFDSLLRVSVGKKVEMSSSTW